MFYCSNISSSLSFLPGIEFGSNEASPLRSAGGSHPGCYPHQRGTSSQRVVAPVKSAFHRLASSVLPSGFLPLRRCPSCIPGFDPKLQYCSLDTYSSSGPWVVYRASLAFFLKAGCWVMYRTPQPRSLRKITVGDTPIVVRAQQQLQPHPSAHLFYSNLLSLETPVVPHLYCGSCEWDGGFLADGSIRRS